MPTHRMLPTIALIAVSAIVIAGCGPVYDAVNDAVKGRELVCGTTPRPLCERLVDLAIRDGVTPEEATTLTVEDASCDLIPEEPTAVRCWMIDGAIGPDRDPGGFKVGEFRTLVYTRADGTLVAWH